MEDYKVAPAILTVALCFRPKPRTTSQRLAAARGESLYWRRDYKQVPEETGRREKDKSIDRRGINPD